MTDKNKPADAGVANDGVSTGVSNTGVSNTGVSWNGFDPDAYVAHYYQDPHPDDDEVVALTARAFAAWQPPAGKADCIDVGTGPNLFPLLAALPRAASLTAWEYGAGNVAWLRSALQAPALAPEWLHFWSVVTAAYGAEAALPSDPLPALRALGTVEQRSIFDLPRRGWDAATMFFCAESITSRRDEFEAACACYAGAVRPGGLLVAAFLAGSGGYAVGGVDYPALSLSVADIVATFEPLAQHVEARPIGAHAEEIRSGYSGMVFLSALAR